MKLKELMKKTKTKRETLANFLQIPKATLDNYIAERRQPDIETIKKIANYFNVSLDYLLNLEKTTSVTDKQQLELIQIINGMDKNDINKIIGYAESLKQKEISTDEKINNILKLYTDKE